ncbi:hypothetical protein ACHHYP_13452 [Achlya hypogyna]|uniref:Endonuclease/exonuclease/phosphatase domain-containing protein n=1 Tax=Achlya hypogyna TaxID=1202772 RepID=A0A1V9YFA3_ACHHY|nr:hypothetical protein ACHHYP_13452 [Achlya hypogyna]
MSGDNIGVRDSSRYWLTASVISGSSYRVLFNHTTIPAALLLGNGQTVREVEIANRAGERVAAVLYHKIHRQKKGRNAPETEPPPRSAQRPSPRLKPNANQLYVTTKQCRLPATPQSPYRQDTAVTTPVNDLAADVTSPVTLTIEGAGQADMDLGGAHDGQDVVVTSIDASAGLYTRPHGAASTFNMFDAFADAEEDDIADADMDPNATEFLPHFRATAPPYESHAPRNRNLGTKKVTAAELARRADTTSKTLVETQSGLVSALLLTMTEDEPDIVNAVMFHCRQGGATSFTLAHAIRRAITRSTRDPLQRGPALDQVVANQPDDDRTMAQMFAAVVAEPERDAALALACLDLVFRLRGRDLYENDAQLSQAPGEPVLRTSDALLSDKSLVAVVTHPQFAPRFTQLNEGPAKSVGKAFDTLLPLFVDSAPECDAETGALRPGALASQCEGGLGCLAGTRHLLTTIVETTPARPALQHRYLLVRGFVGELPVYLHNVYAPSDPASRSAFFATLRREFRPDAVHIVGGDFNVILHDRLDSVAPLVASRTG